MTVEPLEAPVLSPEPLDPPRRSTCPSATSHPHNPHRPFIDSASALFQATSVLQSKNTICSSVDTSIKA